MPEAAQFSAVYRAPAFFLRKIFSGLRAPWVAVSGGVWKFNAMRNAVRYMKKREAMTRGEAAFRTSFPEPSNSGIFLSQERMCAECNVPRGTAIAPAQWKAKIPEGGRSSAPKRKPHTTPRHLLTARKLLNRRTLLQRSSKRLAAFLASSPNSTTPPSENPQNTGFFKSNFIFSK